MLTKTAAGSDEGSSEKGEELKLDESPCEQTGEATKYPDFISAIFSAVD